MEVTEKQVFDLLEAARLVRRSHETVKTVAPYNLTPEKESELLTYTRSHNRKILNGWDGQCVYFIRAMNIGLIKIGHSRDIRRRFYQLSRDSSILKIELLLPGAPSDERQLHKRFRQYRHHGEWFIGSQELEEFMVSA